MKGLRLTAAWAAGLVVAAALPHTGITLVFAAIGALGIGDDVKIVAVDGTSVLVSQDGFDGDRVDIHTQHDEYQYMFAQSAPELSGGPGLKTGIAN